MSPRLRMRIVPAGLAAAAAVLVAAAAASAQSVRDHTRLTPGRSTAVTESQATELTLTVTDVAMRPIQIWVRAAGGVDPTGTKITAAVPPGEGALIRVGQRVRAFPPESRSSMYQAKVSQVVSQGHRALVTATLSGQGREGSTRYVLEIVTESSDVLSVPNEAIIETGDTRIVYVQQAPGRYLPKEIRLGVQGELFTQVLDGVAAGDQVVTIGSFFIDADYKLKGS